LLRISSEDALFSYISSRICSDAEYLDLLQFVQFEYVSAECVSDFLSALPDSIDRRLWESISRRLPSSDKKVEFALKEAESFEGIISYLTGKHGGNVHDKGIVTITSKYVWDDRCAVQNLADLTSEMYFGSENEPGQWVCWDFHEMRVRPAHYTIRCVNLKSWVIEGSLDFVNWTEIDRKTDNEDFKVWGTAWFGVSKSAECRFIRLTETGKRHWPDDYLWIQTFEIFGTLLE
jgi:hypothetical protein